MMQGKWAYLQNVFLQSFLCCNLHSDSKIVQLFLSGFISSYAAFISVKGISPSILEVNLIGLLQYCKWEANRRLKTTRLGDLEACNFTDASSSVTYVKTVKQEIDLLHRRNTTFR